jgi:DNA-directed RNA polymerase specialized sigma24 family protein
MDEKTHHNDQPKISGGSKPLTYHGLQSRKWQPRYSSSREDLVGEFYAPALDASKSYRRAAGYFRSTLFTLVGAPMAAFALRGGKMQLICSPEFSTEDARAIDHAMNIAEATDAALIEELRAVLAHPLGRDPIEVLGAMLGTGALEMKIAVPAAGGGIFHSKVGIFKDAAGQRISFSGSVNESWSGWHPLGNHENFEVFTSWGSEGQRVADHESYFTNLWNAREPGVMVVPIPEAFKLNLVREVRGDPDERLRMRVHNATPGPPPRRLLDHQVQALSSWRAAGLRGILQHATGAGKTITGLHAIREGAIEGRPGLILVPSALLLQQWASEAKRELADLDPSILLVGGGHKKWRTGSLLEGHLSDGATCHVVIATIQSATSSRFMRALGTGTNQFTLVADEVHRLGAPQSRTILDHIDPPARLGLSATPLRSFDDAGTEALLDFFGGVLEPIVTLRDAIDAGRLCEYEYWPTVVHLVDGQMEMLTKEIRTITGFDVALAELVRDVMGRRRQRTVIDNLMDRCRDIAKSHPFELHGSGASLAICIDGMLGNPLRGSDARELRDAGQRVALLPRIPARTTERAPRIFRSETLSLLLQSLIEVLERPLLLNDLRRIFELALTDLAVRELQYLEVSASEEGDAEPEYANLDQATARGPGMAEPEPDPALLANAAAIAGNMYEELTEDQRTIVRLKLGNTSDSDIARALQISRPTAAKRKDEALEVLRRNLEGISDLEVAVAMDRLVERLIGQP